MKILKAGYHGLWFPELGISLDGYHPEADYLFVSHAHADHMPRNRQARAYATPPTLDLMEVRGFSGERMDLNFGEFVETDSFRVSFYPAGHILGSAMIFIESDFGSLLYTGDFKIPPSPATEGFEAPDSVDYLITEATFGLPIYKWKPLPELVHEVQTFATSTLAQGGTPLFLAYNLGKAQEILHMLAPIQKEIMIHGAGYQLCQVYEKHGIDLGTYTAYDRDKCEGSILIAPSSALSKGFASNVSDLRVAYCSGWAANEAKRSQLTANKMIALSDHLDFFELINFCKSLSPKKVYITHTPNPDVVRHYLDREGIDSCPLNIESRVEKE
jgi:putative mRNA 3-end processing factor